MTQLFDEDIENPSRRMRTANGSKYRNANEMPLIRHRRYELEADVALLCSKKGFLKSKSENN